MGREANPRSHSDRRIIVGLDPEHETANALRLGRLLAAILAARPLLTIALAWPGFLIDDEELQKLADAATHSTFAECRKAFGSMEIETRAITRRSAAEALHWLAEEEDAKLIVLGSGHRGPLGRTFPGSVAESLLQGATCAIAVAPRGYAERTEHRLHRIAVAFDGSPESWSALETGIALAQRCHGELSIIVVAEPFYGFGAYGAAMAAGDFQQAERDEKKRYLDTALARVPPGLPAEGTVLSGAPATLLALESSNFDLMIVGSRGYGPLRRTLLGSTTRRLLYDAGCAVLILPRGAGLDPLGLKVPSDGHVKELASCAKPR